MNAAHELLKAQLNQAGLWDGWETEFRFHPTRRWRFDFAHPERKVAVEVHGGIHAHGRHTRGRPFQRDREKMNAAAILGWTVLEVTTEHVMESQYALDMIREALA